MKNLILLFFNLLLLTAIATQSWAQCSLPNNLSAVLNSDGTVTFSWNPQESFADFLSVNNGDFSTIPYGDMSVIISTDQLIPGTINTICLNSFCALPEGGFDSGTSCINIFIPFDCNPNCSVTAGNPESYCVTNLECIPLNGGITSGTTQSDEVSWSVLNTPNGVPLDQVQINNSNNPTATACFQNGSWVPGQYTFLLMTKCSNDCPTAQEVVITIDPEPIFYLNTDGFTFTFQNALACSEMNIWVDLSLPFPGTPAGIIPDGSIGVWTWDDVGDLNYEVEVIDDQNINVSARNFDRSQCGESLTVTHTLTTPGGCVSSRSMDVSFFAADLANAGNTIGIQACTNPEFPTNVTINLPFSGCNQFFESPFGGQEVVDFIQTGGPEVDLNDFNPTVVEGYLDAMTINTVSYTHLTLPTKA